MASGEDSSNGWGGGRCASDRSRMGISNLDEGENYDYAAARL